MGLRKWQITKSGETIPKWKIWHRKHRVIIKTDSERHKLISTWHTGGLHKIEDGHNYGNYAMIFTQNKNDEQISKIFEESVFWTKEWNKDRNVKHMICHMYINGGPTRTEEQFFFDRTCAAFEVKMEKAGYKIEKSG